MASSQSTRISSLIKQLSAIEQQSDGSIYENENLRTDAAHLVRKLAVALERPQEVPAQTAAVRIAVDLHLFHHLGDGPQAKDISELALKTGADAELLIRILRLLSAMGWVDQVRDICFKPTPITRTLKESESLQAGVKHMYLSLPVYDKLPKYFADYDYKPPVDVRDGGGKGHDLNKFITTVPDAKGRYVLEDLPVVIDDTYDRNPRIDAVKHDFFQEQPIQGARIYFMHHVLHDWPDNDVVRIFSQIANVMKPGYSRSLLGENVFAGYRLSPLSRFTGLGYDGTAFWYDENGRTMESVT
ncbi:Winged helix-turn-helix transcription repressor DNA-binding [Penicillium occitanis (nom. inval.)]|nr:Winged helix-turn-helix transcription repressor DNA-binding [Penicillium occitanis (nom. inval.)]PCH08424.1 hypothetical protein PENOC_014860 [Penicillium occitanis (nom. inval.)]